MAKLTQITSDHLANEIEHFKNFEIFGISNFYNIAIDPKFKMRH